MKCMRCGNEDPTYFYLDKDTYYCRKCIQFGRIDVGKPLEDKTWKHPVRNVEPKLAFDLTDAQKQASKSLIEALKEKQNVLVYAAAGAGKTEIVLDSISLYLSQGKKVGMAISRRQVVLEIQERMQKAFPSLKVIAVCEGHTKVVDGDLIICTMHQLFRYVHAFDLLIMDEVDAFPYYGNELLETIATNSVQGEVVYLTATPDAKMLETVEAGTLKEVCLFKRPHGYPLVMPKLVYGFAWMQAITLVKLIRDAQKQQTPLLIFVPTIRLAAFYGKLYGTFFKVQGISSLSQDKDEAIAKLKTGKLVALFTTTILERGITIPHVDVCILHADHAVYQEAGLIQMLGRVGRSYDCPTGNAWLLCTRKTKAIQRCMAMLSRMNESRE